MLGSSEIPDQSGLGFFPRPVDVFSRPPSRFQPANSRRCYLTAPTTLKSDDLSMQNQEKVTSSIPVQKVPELIKSQNDPSNSKSQEVAELERLRTELHQMTQLNVSNTSTISVKSSEIDELKNRLSEATSANERLALKSKEIDELKSRLSEAHLSNTRFRTEIEDMRRQLTYQKSSDPSDDSLAVQHDLRGARILEASNSSLVKGSVEATHADSSSFYEADTSGDQKELADEVRSQVKKLFTVKDERFWKKTYEKHKEHSQMSKENFRLALHELGIFLDEEGEREVFEGADNDQDQALDFNEFLLAVKKPSKVEQWTAGLPLTKLVAAAFVPIIRQSKFKDDPLVALSECSTQTLSLVINVLKEGLHELLWKHISELKTGYRAMKNMKLDIQENQAQSKFSSGGEVGVMSCGKINDFYGGLGSRVGQYVSLNVI
jgi:hypothetical protein